MPGASDVSSGALRPFRRIFKDWESEIARPVMVALLIAFTGFLFSLLFAPVRRFLFNSTVPYPIYCTAETYSLPDDLTSARTELLLINTTDEIWSRSKLERELLNAGNGLGPPSPDLWLHYKRGYGTVVRAESDMTNGEKGQVDVHTQGDGRNVVVSPQLFKARAILRVIIDVTGLEDRSPITRAAHNIVPFRIDEYEQACYTRSAPAAAPTSR
jgi:hypothetical protein